MPVTELDLFALRIADDDVGDHNVSEAGWYAVDGVEKVVLGPFESLQECEHAIRDRLNPPPSYQSAPPEWRSPS